MEKKYKNGEMVRHKTGGPQMVVIGYEPEDGYAVTCEWMDKQHTPHQRSFLESSLIKWESNTEPIMVIAQPKNKFRF